MCILSLEIADSPEIPKHRGENLAQQAQRSNNISNKVLWEILYLSKWLDV